MKNIIFIIAVLCLPVTLRAQIFRIDPVPVYTTSNSVSPGAAVPMLAIPGATIELCQDMACTMPALTYTGATGAVGCPINAPVTLPTSALCQSTSGPQGEFGFWVNAGTYYYMITLPNGTVSGPYPVSSTQAAGGGQIFSIPGVFDNADQTISDIIAMEATVGASVNASTMRQQITNVTGNRPGGAIGAVIVPATSISYETCAVCGLIYAGTDNTNTVAGSFFVAPNVAAPGGTVNVDATGLIVTWVSGTLFSTVWGTNGDSQITINGVDTEIATVSSPTLLTLSQAIAGPQTGVSYYRYFDEWSINTIAEDYLPGVSITPLGPAYMTNEWDFNLQNPQSIIIAHSIGGAGNNVQALTEVGYLVNTPGSGDKWDCGFCTEDGTAAVGLVLGTAEPGNNTGSQPIQFYSRDSSGNTSSSVISIGNHGDFIFRVGFTYSGMGTFNPEIVFQDGGGNEIVGIQGSIGELIPRLVGFPGTSFKPGFVAQSALAGLTAGATIGDIFTVTGAYVGAGCPTSGAVLAGIAVFNTVQWNCY